MNNEIKLTLRLDSPDLDEEELSQAHSNLLSELRNIDGWTEETPPTEETLPGQKGDPVTLGTVVIALASAGVFTALVECLRYWLTRDDRRRLTLSAEIEGNTIVIDSTQFTEEQIADLVAMASAALSS